MNEIYLIIGGLAILLPLIMIYKTPYAGAHEMASIMLRLAIGVPIFIIIYDIFAPVMEAAIGPNHFELALLSMMSVFSIILTLSLYSPPSGRFYSNGSVKLYSTYGTDSNVPREYTTADHQTPSFTIELHKGDCKLIQHFDSDEDLLESLEPESKTTCWYCYEESRTYLSGAELDQYSHSHIHTTGPRRSPHRTGNGLCKSCSFMLIERLNENYDKEFSEEDIVAAQI